MNEFAMKRSWGPPPNYPRVLTYQRPTNDFIVVAGPCSVEDEVQINKCAHFVAHGGGTHLRGGLFRAGTYPGAKYGYVDESLFKAFQKAAHDNGLKTVIEVIDYTEHRLDMILKYADCLQIGCRAMQHYPLLRMINKTGKQIFLKRSQGSTIDELLGAAEHLLQGDCHPVLVERGSSTNAKHVRWDLSISMIPAVKQITKIPIIVDASHGTGRRDLVGPMTLAGVAAGADGLLCEIHPCPEESISDADQAIGLWDFLELMKLTESIRGSLNCPT